MQPNQGSNLQSSYVLWPGIKPTTFWCMGGHSNWATRPGQRYVILTDPSRNCIKWVCAESKCPIKNSPDKRGWRPVLWQRGKTSKTWEAKLLEIGTSLGVRVRKRKEAIRPQVWGPSWQQSERWCCWHRWRMEEKELMCRMQMMSHHLCVRTWGTEFLNLGLRVKVSWAIKIEELCPIRK